MASLRKSFEKKPVVQSTKTQINSTKTNEIVEDTPKTTEIPEKFQDSKNIIEHYSAGAKQDVFMEVPEYGFMMKRKEDSYDAVIRFNFQTLTKSYKQTGFGSYYLDVSRFLGLIAIVLNGKFAEREKVSRADTSAFPKPIFEDEKPGQGDEYKYFAILPGKKEGKILVRYIQRDIKTKKQVMNVLIPFDEDVFYGKMMRIYQLMMQKQ